MKITMNWLALFGFMLAGPAVSSDFEKFWAVSATSRDEDVKCITRSTSFLATSGSCKGFIPQRTYKLGDKISLGNKQIQIQAILVTRYLKPIKGDERFGLRPIPAGSMTCSIAATKEDALAITNTKLSTTWIQIHSCIPN